MKEKQKSLNDDIRASIVQLVSDEGENLWEMSLNEAKAKAKEQWLDLMEIWRNWKVSIVKILDYWKFLYKRKKQDQKNKRKWKTPDLKTIRITFKISEHDLQIRAKQALWFAEHSHPLKVTLMLKWRENHYVDIASEKMKSFVTMIEEVYKIDSEIKKTWNTFTAMLKPKK